MKRILICISITLMLAPGVSVRAGVTGQWEFNGDFSASIGAAIVPQGTAVSGSVFGTTTTFGIAPIGGQVAQVMMFPQTLTAADGYKMFPGAAANGSFSAGDVNRYSLVMDVLFPTASDNTYRALFQTAAANNNDADFFIGDNTVLPQPNGIGISGQYDGTILPNTWYRIALVVNLDLPTGTPTYYKYINGALVGSQELRNSRFAPWSLDSGNPSWIFSDNDGETALGYVNSVQFSDYDMTSAQLAFLGGPSAAGIAVSPEPGSGLLLGAGLLLLARRLLRRAQ